MGEGYQLGVLRKMLSNSNRPTSAVWDHARTFVKGVRCVVAASSEEKMVWPNTLRSVAFMQNLHILRDWAEMQLPRIAMRFNFVPPCNTESAVSTSFISTMQSADPEPAIICFMNKLPKAFAGWNRLRSAASGTITFLAAIFTSRMIGWREGFAASGAGAYFGWVSFLGSGVITSCTAIFSDRGTVGGKCAIAH